MARGEIETEDGVLVIRRIHVLFTLRGASPEHHAEPAQRAHEVFKPHCPVYRSIHRAIAITTELKLVGLEAG
jgi:uncharacterized OsmC-like protein